MKWCEQIRVTQISILDTFKVAGVYFQVKKHRTVAPPLLGSLE